MPLRSEQKYLILHKCYACNNNYYSDKNFDYKCSGCWGYCTKNNIMTGTEFGEKCEEWARNNVVDEDGRHFILTNKYISDQHLFNFLTGIFENTGKYISAETGLKLFKANPTNNRGHIVGSFISDWWKIKSLNVNEENKWPLYMECYYGNYSEDISKWPGKKNENTIPSKKPRGKNNSMINKKIIMNMKY